MCLLDFGDSAEAYHEAPHVAWKEHSCLGCGAAIHTGEAYCRVFYVSDGHGTSEKECFACWWTRREFWEAHGGGPLPRALGDYLRECVGGERNNKWRPHLAALRRRWRVSEPRLRAIRAGWLLGALQRQFALTRRIIRERVATP